MTESGLQAVVGTPSELSEDSAQDCLDSQLVESLLEMMTQMKAIRPEIVRGIPVHRFLQRMPCKGLAKQQRMFYGLSKVTKQLDEFWSHSWRTKAWLKYVNILFLNNGFPAFVVGTLCALVAFSLSLAGILPLQRVAGPANAWCTIAGSIGYYVTLLLWPSRKLAFFDIACINQRDEIQKSEALLSPRSDTSVLVCPVFVGPALLVGNIGSSVLLLALLCSGLPLFPWAGIFISAMVFPCMVFLAYVILAHCRSIDVMQHQVRHFTVEHSLCHCCESGHVNANGGQLMCDRLIILRCISAWFGSVDAFESLVRTRLLKTLVYQLANQVFSYWRIVQVAIPVAWAVLDLLDWNYQDLPAAVLLQVGSLMFGAYFFCEHALRQLSADHFGNWVAAHLVALTFMGTVTLVLWRHLPAIERAPERSDRLEALYSGGRLKHPRAYGRAASAARCAEQGIASCRFAAMSASGLQIVLGSPSESEKCPPISLDSQYFDRIMTDMRAISPDIVRGIPVHRFLQRMPCKWLAREKRNFYGLSQVTNQLDEFWSHSWRTNAGLKYVNILFLNNGFPAFVVGTLCALVAFSLNLAGILPKESVAGPANAWCTTSGVIGYYVTLLLWRSRKLAFLDVACISQTDRELNGLGLLSMGGFLRCSQSLLVLWDETVVTRLWCMFEMAGFLHSKGPNADKSVLVCPVFTGPALFVGHLGVSVLLLALLCADLQLFPWGGIFISAMVFPCLVFLAYVVLAHCRSIDVMQHQVRHFTVEQSFCHCCDNGHVGANGGEITCDRLTILRCISAWFGSVETFEALVRTQVSKMLVYQLANQVFSYWRIVQAASPVAWAILDMLDRNLFGITLAVPQTSLAAVTYVFCYAPSISLILLRLAYRVRNLGHSKWTQWLLAVALLAVGSLIFVAYFWCEHAIKRLSDDLFGNWMPANIALLIVTGAATLVLWRHLPAIETTP
ncbi:fam213a [Symbiodinium natans]|uniref:Fam213a protein n=1 Tax=Symbiodinium natans TaxID=878477 RepID=A0A812TB82_9DINO|nr:fam213a [Symbiodinium natans]